MLSKWLLANRWIDQLHLKFSVSNSKSEQERAELKLNLENYRNLKLLQYITQRPTGEIKALLITRDVPHNYNYLPATIAGETGLLQNGTVQWTSAVGIMNKRTILYKRF